MKNELSSHLDLEIKKREFYETPKYNRQIIRYFVYIDNNTYLRNHGIFYIESVGSSFSKFGINHNDYAVAKEDFSKFEIILGDCVIGKDEFLKLINIGAIIDFNTLYDFGITECSYGHKLNFTQQLLSNTGYFLKNIEKKVDKYVNWSNVYIIDKYPSIKKAIKQ